VGASCAESGPGADGGEAKAEYPPRRELPKTQPASYPTGDCWVGAYGQNTPVFKSAEPLPPVGQVSFFRVAGQEDVEQAVYSRASTDSSKVASRQHGEVVRVVDFQGPWARLACETEAELDEDWQGWMLIDGVDGEALLDEIEDPKDSEREYAKSLFQRIWRINDHVTARLRDRTSGRAKQYMDVGRLPPGKRDQLPEGTRCVNAFWGLEARWVRVGPGKEYWPQGCLTLPDSYLRAGWEQPVEESRSGHWRVFAARSFGANELIEVCPLVKVDTEVCIASMQLRMNIVETPADEDAAHTGQTGRVQSYVPLGFGMLYQQSIELDDVQINWKPVTNFNCKFVPVNGHMYIYATRNIQADEELILEYKRAFRTDLGEPINFEGFTPYWCRQNPPEIFAEALAASCESREPRPVPGCVKFGKSQLHDRGIFSDAAYGRGEIIEMCPCLVLDLNGAVCMQDHCFYMPEVTVELEGRSITKREGRYVLPCGYGGLYNHLEAGKGENIEWLYDETTQCFLFISAPQGEGQEIPRNCELCFDYGEAYWDAPSRRFQRPNRQTRDHGLLRVV